MAVLRLLEVMDVRAGEMAGRVVAELHHMEARADDEIAASCVLLLDGHVADDVIGAPRRLLRPGARVGEPLQSHGHQVAVFPEDRRHAVTGGLLGCRRHPVGAVLGEQIDEILPALAVEAFGLAVEELLDVTQRIVPIRLPRFGSRLACRMLFLAVLFLARSWRSAWSSSPSVRPVHVLGPGLELVAHRLLGGADDRGRHVVGLEVLPGVAVEADPIAALRFEALVDFQKFHRSSALTSVDGELTRL